MLIYGKEFKWYRIERDEEMIQNRVSVEKDFWENHVLKRIMPPPDGSELADKVIAGYFRESDASRIHLQGFDEKLQRREELSALIEDMETEKRQIEQEVKLYMGAAEVAENEVYRVLWKNVTSSRIDMKRLKEEKPEIYSQYCNESVSRRFQVKAA